MDNALLGLLGLAKKAGKLALGEEEAASAALAHKTKLLLVASDAAEDTAKRSQRAAEATNALCFQVPLTKTELGGAAGRATCAALAVTDTGFAASLLKKLAQTDPAAYGEAAEKLTHKAEKTVRRRREKRARQKGANAPRPWAAPPKEKQS